MDPNAVIDRVMRLARFDTTVFDEVRDDQNETVPAVVLVVISAFLAGLGAWLFWEIAADFFNENAFVNSFIIGSILFIVAYALATLVTYLMLVQVYRVQVELLALVRTMGYASIPIAISLLMLIPVIYPLFAVVAVALLFVMMIHATAAASGASSSESTISAAVGFAVLALVLGFLAQQADAGDAPWGAGLFGLFFDPSF